MVFGKTLTRSGRFLDPFRTGARLDPLYTEYNSTKTQQQLLLLPLLLAIYYDYFSHLY